MWKSFQEAFEKRVRKGEITISPQDIHRITYEVIESLYGKQGLKNLKIEIVKSETIRVIPANSLWASEIRMQSKKMCKEINNRLGKEEVKRVIVKK